MPSAAGATQNKFEGRLTLTAELAGSQFTAISDPSSLSNAFGGAAKHLPPFDFSFVQFGNALIPAQRGSIPSTHPFWEFILEPGTVTDNGTGMTQAKLPFALEERNENCIHNGVLSFTFNNSGTVSDVSYIIAAETCATFKFDMSGSWAATYTPGKVTGRTRLIADYDHETTTRLPTKTFADLAVDHPGMDATQFGSPLEVNPADMTFYGLVLDGVNYVGGCNTRAGAYPFCNSMAAPSYSVAKSVFAGTTAMRLAQLYPKVMRQKIADFVPECAASGQWGDVTFANALDLATGNYNSNASMADESAADMWQFFYPDTHAGKIAFACGHFPRKTTPGTQWVYHTPDTYVLGTALRAFYAKKTKPTRDFYRDLLIDPIWHRLGLHPTLDVTRRTYDSVAQPFSGYGLTLMPDDIAKLAIFLNNDRGKILGEQMIDIGMLDAAFQRNKSNPGLPAGSADLRYNNGYWAFNAQATLGCPAPTWIPFMSGFGGITIALLPNGMTYYYVSDGNSYTWSRAIREANKFRPFCKH
ncbi:MAG TPA: serine hydrolase [Rhizomicrobium sp.]|nr:serine hydrolase [Rhizomicrobium sp.]